MRDMRMVGVEMMGVVMVVSRCLTGVVGKYGRLACFVTGRFRAFLCICRCGSVDKCAN